jgi:type I restriction enzyme S subunit
MNNRWIEKSLGDVITLQRGFDLPERERASGTVPIVSSSGITGYHSTSRVSSPGVVTGRYGTLGEVFYIESDFWPLNTTLWVKDFKGNNPRYVSYLLRTLNIGLQNAAGAVPGVNRNALHMLPVRIPSHMAQERIASALSAYDDLIENNTRRIKILQQMAQMLYREWFVKFCFSEYQKTPMIKSAMGQIPKGWVLGTFGALFNIKYGKNLPTSLIAESGQFPVYGAGSVIGYYDQCVLEDKVCLVTCRGNGSGTVWRTREAAFITNNSLMMRPNEKFSHWSHFFIELVAKHSNIRGVISGSAQPQITIEGLQMVPVIIPERSLVEKFCYLMSPAIELVDLLYRNNMVLRKIRDLLLPNLMSGEISVEQLESKTITQNA